MSLVLQDIADMAIDFGRSCGYSLPYLKSNMFHPQILVLLKGPTDQLQKAHNNHQLDRKSPSVGIAMENTTKRTVQQPPNKVPPKNTNQ